MIELRLSGRRGTCIVKITTEKRRGKAEEADEKKRTK